MIGSEPLYDIGSGNGFPGLIFGVLDPMRHCFLVERDQRKSEYLKHVISELRLANVAVLNQSCENLPKASVVNAIARGFAPLSAALLQLIPQIRVGGRFFHMKGDGFAAELARVPSQLFTKWSNTVLGSYMLPESSVQLTILETDRIGE